MQKLTRRPNLCESMENIKNNKTTANDGLIKEFYKNFWDELKTSLMESIN